MKSLLPRRSFPHHGKEEHEALTCDCGGPSSRVPVPAAWTRCDERVRTMHRTCMEGSATNQMEAERAPTHSRRLPHACSPRAPRNPCSCSKRPCRTRASKSGGLGFTTPASWSAATNIELATLVEGAGPSEVCKPVSPWESSKRWGKNLNQAQPR